MFEFYLFKTLNKIHIWKDYNFLVWKHILFIKFGFNMIKIFKFEFLGLFCDFQKVQKNLGTYLGFLKFWILPKDLIVICAKRILDLAFFYRSRASPWGWRVGPAHVALAWRQVARVCACVASTVYDRWGPRARVAKQKKGWL